MFGLSRLSPPNWRGLLAAGLLSCTIGVTLADEPFKVGRFPVQHISGTAAEIGTSSIAQPKRPLSLNYRTASWRKVLEDVTESSGHTLVMNVEPPGTFSRRDGNQYTFPETVRILNFALEKHGFRLVEQGQYLIVIALEELRTKYERSPVPRRTGGVAHVPNNPATHHSAEPIPVPEYPRNFSRVTPAIPERSGNYPQISQVEFEEPARPQAVPAPPKLAPIVQEELTPRHSAVDVAKVVHVGFGNRSHLLKSGPEGLPAFEIRQEEIPGARPAQRVAVGIDVEKNRLVVQGPEPAVRQFEQTIELIEHAVDQGEETIRVVPSDRDVELLARQLGPSMNQLLAQRAQLEPVNQATAQPQPPNVPQTDTQPGEQPQEPLSTLQPNLRSNVTVQAIPGVGLVVTGNAADVEAVMSVIREIEKLSVGIKPSIRIHHLEHVDSSQLAQLLTSVYETLTEASQLTIPGQAQVVQRPQVSFIPVTKPNAIVIIAPDADMPNIIQTATELDQPVDPTTEFEIFPLKSAIATQAATLLTNFFAEREGLGGTITAFADVRTNTIIVRARPRDLKEAASLIQKIDNDASGAVNKIKVLPLKNAVAQEVADVLNQVLQSLILPPGQTNQTAGAAFNFTGVGESSTQIREIKSITLEFLKSHGGKEQMIRSGIMADVRITADPRINSLIITAPERSMELMEALIDKLDLIPSSVAEIKVFTLRNADATQAVDLLNALFTTTTGGGAAGQQVQGLQVSGATSVTNSLVSLRFSADVRTNSVLAVGGADVLDVVDSILLRLDQDNVRARKYTTIRLKYTPAEDVATAVNGFLDQQRALYDAQPDLISNVQLLEQEIVVMPEAITNTLIVSAAPQFFDVIKNMVARLDQAPPQVIIQALLVEVALDNTDEFGMEVGLQDSILFNRSLTDAMTGLNPGFLFNSGTALGNADGTMGTNIVGGQGLSNFGVGRSNSDLGFGGLVLSASSENVSVLIRALASRQHVHVLSRPQIRTLDNVQSQIQVGQQVPIILGGQTTQLGTFTPQIEQQDVGIILAVRPRINPDGTIVMETAATKSNLSGQGVPIFFNSDGSTVDAPIINITTASATVSVPNGHTVVLGGMITEMDTTIERKIPWLGDVPILGRAFRFDSTSTARTELLIFLTPRVILNDADSEFIKQVETERTHIIEEQVEDTHGPIFGVPPMQSQPMIYQLPTEGRIQLPDGSWMDSPNGQEPELPRGEEQSLNGKTQPAEPETSIQQVAAWQNDPTTFKPVRQAQPAQFIRPSAEGAKPPTPSTARPQKKKRRLWPF